MLGGGLNPEFVNENLKFLLDFGKTDRKMYVFIHNF